MVGQTGLRIDELIWVADVGVLYCTALKDMVEVATAWDVWILSLRLCTVVSRQVL